jgi:NAD(P)-dependent dehydrogenase (short-subunit alcohol dehydrogenase family)
MGRLQNKIAIITGGSGGIGFSTAKLFVKEGAKVLLVDINEKALQDCIAEIGENCSYEVADVSIEDQVNHYTKTAIERYGRIDIVLLNAGTEGPVKLLIEYTAEEFDKLISINLRGVWLGIKAAVPQMINTGGGSITITSSIAGLEGNIGSGPYATSKHALIGLMRSAALEYAGFGIRINTVHPGYTETRMMRSLEVGHASMAKQFGMPISPEEIKKSIESMIPLKRYTGPEEIANMFLFLSSDDAKYITGSCYTVDGGWSAGRMPSARE